MKPNMDHKNFVNFMQKKNNIHMDVRNKAISRKVHKTAEDKAFAETNLATNFSSAQGLKYKLNRNPTGSDKGQVNQILHALEIVNKEAMMKGVGGGLHGPASKMLNGINMLRAKQDYGALSFLSGENPLSTKDSNQTAQGKKIFRNYKAELVRCNVVTRTDLIKLYHPPLKKSQMPHRDPFVNRSIVPGPTSMREEVVGGKSSTAYQSKSNFGSKTSNDNSARGYATTNGTFPRVNGSHSHMANNVAQNMYNTQDHPSLAKNQ